MQKTLIFIGLAILAAGLLWPFLSKLGLGRLPGDITFRREGFSVHFPIVTCLLLSAGLSLLFWLLRK